MARGDVVRELPVLGAMTRQSRGFGIVPLVVARRTTTLVSCWAIVAQGWLAACGGTVAEEPSGPGAADAVTCEAAAGTPFLDGQREHNSEPCRWCRCDATGQPTCNDLPGISCEATCKVGDQPLIGNETVAPAPDCQCTCRTEPYEPRLDCSGSCGGFCLDGLSLYETGASFERGECETCECLPNGELACVHKCDPGE